MEDGRWKMEDGRWEMGVGRLKNTWQKKQKHYAKFI